MGSMMILLQGYATFILLLSVSISSGLSAAEKPPPEPKQHNKIIHQKQQIMESAFATERDTIPIINPSTPGTVTPIINPLISPPPPEASIPTFPYPVTPTTPTTTSSGGTWCIATSSASQTALQVAIDYACGYGGADCSAIQPGSSCYNPNTLQDHASYAFNDYYQKNPVPTSCVFGGVAQLTYADPSQGNCHFPSSRTSTTVTPKPVTPTPVTPTPVTPVPVTPVPVTPTPVIPSPFYVTPTPTDSGVYGPPYGVAVPTGSPNSAVSTTCSLLVLITSGLVASMIAYYV